MTDDLITEPAAERRPPPVDGPTRSRRHKVIGGVCGGFGRYCHLDPVIFRVPLAVLSVVGGLGFVAYGLAWLLIPFEGEEENEGRRLLSGRVEGPGLTALLFIVAGCGLLLASLGNQGPATWFSVMILVVLAAAAHWSRRRGAAGVGQAGGAQVVAEAPPEAQAPPAPLGPSWWQGSAAGGYLWGPADARPGDFGPTPGLAAHDGAAGGGWAPREPQAPPAPAAGRRELRLGGLVQLLASIACVTGTALTWDEPLGTALVVGLSAALAVYGVGLVVSAFVGRLGGGTVVAVVLTGGMLAGASALPDSITTGWSSPEWRPTEASAVRAAYELGTGDAVLDLSALDLPADRTLRTAVEAGAGEIRVVVPHDARVITHTEIGAGAFHYEALSPALVGRPDDSWGGLGEERTDTYGPEPGVEPGGTLELRVEMGIGHVVVERP
ncbi:PspC domain-containing protein [Streptomyces sp. NBC_01803]|uniref:PspC domain-containing protein n=1 Tax=Streptomyces sp. NBC_01803 TaxID=2975946 RepID=UPI002DDC24EB|nr:PspC domain-containing protein [Streptomyces sp. NBC_01803]WSA45848.1 PspC domain-containing protein [Streptomyces sp. NBC_01803]